MAEKDSTINSVEGLAFWENLINFLNHVEGLNKSLLSVDMINKIYKSDAKKIDDFIKNNAENLSKKKGVTYFTVPPNFSSAYKKLRREHRNSGIALDVLPKSLFVSAVSRFDVFMGNTVKIILEKHPDIISPDKTLKFSDINGFKTIKEAINHLIDKEIDALLRDSHRAHLEWLSKKIGVDFSNMLSLEIPTFIELTERRNLFVHADGLINEPYIRNCKNNNVLLSETQKKGCELDISLEYFKSSMGCLHRMATKISFVVWMKFEPAEIRDANIFFINDIIINLINEKEYKLAEDLLGFALSEFGESDDEMKRAMVINLSLTKKLDGRGDEAIIEIDKLDWSACSIDFKLGIATIKDDYDEVYKLMERVSQNSRFFTKQSYKDAPIFEKLRNHTSFPSIFEKIYGEKFILPVEKMDE